SCARFLDDWQIQPVVVERPVASRTWWYSGTPDVIGDVPDGRRKGQAQEERVTWTMDRATKAGFPAKNPNYKTQPQNMLLAR
ncbi:hypothetical protein KBZ21_41050, partial [Streptomyces sp. A73]|nr:hypothetical protein [Streptomyces sp. A73]